jgi:hypothetical protein
MRQHNHSWEFGSATVCAPTRVAPKVEVVYTCRCGGTKTMQLKVRAPGKNAPTDEDVYTRKAERKNEALVRATWGDSAADGMIRDDIRLVAAQESR